MPLLFVWVGVFVRVGVVAGWRKADPFASLRDDR